MHIEIYVSKNCSAPFRLTFGLREIHQAEKVLDALFKHVRRFPRKLHNGSASLIPINIK